jgi:hypothetical protein
MKPSKVCVCLLLISNTVFLNGTLQASSFSRKMGKVHFQQYAGAQQNWPRSTVQEVIINYDMSFYRKLPGRPYQVLGIMSDEGDHAVRHVAEAARLMGADAVLVVGDKAFTDAGLNATPCLLDKVEIPDPRGPAEISHMQHPEALKTGSEERTIRITKIVGILIRWTTK